MARLYIAFFFLFSAIAVPAQILPTFGNSRTGTAGMQFLKAGIDARSMAMSGAVVAITSDPSSMFWNPAGIAQADTLSFNIQSSAASYYSKTRLNQAGVIYHKRKSQTFWGINLISLSTGRMKETTEFQPTGTGRTFAFSDLLAGITYSRVLTDNFCFGVSGKYVNESVAGVQLHNVLFDLGLHYNVKIRNTRFAAVVSNFGVNVKPGGSVQILKFIGPTDITEFEEISAPSVFRVGVASDVFRSNDQGMVASLQLNHPTDNNETLSLGFEYMWKSIFFCRSGFEFGADEGGFPAFGFGVKLPRRFGNLRLDYGMNNKKYLGTVNRVSLAFGLK